MDGQKTYKAFTLIEMLIVMGILIILMVVGVAAGRFAINRANEIANRNGATQLYQAMQAHYTDYGKYPQPATGSTFYAMVTGESGPGTIGQYLDMGSFGGKDATYIYLPNKEYQSMLVCVSLGDIGDEANKGFVCAGNGFGDKDITLTNESGCGNGKELVKDKIEPGETCYDALKSAETGLRGIFKDKKWDLGNDSLKPNFSAS